VGVGNEDPILAGNKFLNGFVLAVILDFGYLLL